MFLAYFLVLLNLSKFSKAKLVGKHFSNVFESLLLKNTNIACFFSLPL